MKPSLIITYSIVCLLAFFGGIFAGLLYTRDENDTVTSADTLKDPRPLFADAASPPPRSLTVPEETPAPTPLSVNQSEQYMLSVSDNGISMYQILPDGTTSFVMSKEANTSDLRQEDFAELCRGIVVNSREEALKLLEDFVG